MNSVTFLSKKIPTWATIGAQVRQPRDDYREVGREDLIRLDWSCYPNKLTTISKPAEGGRQAIYTSLENPSIIIDGASLGSPAADVFTSATTLDDLGMGTII